MLPVELVDCILSNVKKTCDPSGSEFKTTLKACSLVCSGWRHVSQSHLFSRITVKRGRASLDLVRCVAEGDANAARLARYSRFVCLDDHPHLSRTLPLFYRARDPLTTDPILIADSIIMFLDELSMVQELVLLLKMSWDEIGPAGNRTLLRLFGLRSMKTMKLSFASRISISLFPLFGCNIQRVDVWNIGLSLEKPKFPLEVDTSCDDLQTERGPRFVILDLSFSQDLEALVWLSKNVDIAFFTSLRSLTLREPTSFDWDETDMQFFRPFLELCPSLSRIKIGPGTDDTLLPRGFEFEFYASAQIPNKTQLPCFHAVQSMWIDRQDCREFLKLALILLRKPLPLLPVPPLPPTSQADPSLPTSNPVAYRLPDVLTSLTLNFHILVFYGEAFDPIDFCRPFSDMWTSMDKFLTEHFTRLQTLSINIDMGFHDRYDDLRMDALVSEGQNSFPRMCMQLSGASGEESGFERDVEVL